MMFFFLYVNRDLIFFILANSVDPDEMPPCAFTVCQITGIQKGVRISNTIFFLECIKIRQIVSKQQQQKKTTTKKTFFS